MFLFLSVRCYYSSVFFFCIPQSLNSTFLLQLLLFLSPFSPVTCSIALSTLNCFPWQIPFSGCSLYLWMLSIMLHNCQNPNNKRNILSKGTKESILNKSEKRYLMPIFMLFRNYWWNTAAAGVFITRLIYDFFIITQRAVLQVFCAWVVLVYCISVWKLRKM